MAKQETKKKLESAKVNSTNLEKISSRGRIFQGVVVAKFHKRITIELERTVYIPKFERFLKKNTKIHARLPDNKFSEVHVGDIVKVQECRPLSKIIHCVFVEKVKSGVKE